MSARILRVIPNRYYDSVKLLRVSERLEAIPGIHLAAAVMGTPMNMELLVDEGFAVTSARPDDLVVAVRAEDNVAAEGAIREMEALLAESPRSVESIAASPRSIESAIRLHSGTNLAVIAVPGPHAALEAWAAIRAGLNVFLFSDNVAIEDEVRLKVAAAERGLLVMGPDCGTAILDGVGIGFANRVRRGSVGIVGASGTGIQQVACLLHEAGGGVAQAIGTGSRDLGSEVGGIMTLAAIDRLVNDEDVECIALISKPADPVVAGRVLGRLAEGGKPAVACMLGTSVVHPGVANARTLTAAADLLLGRSAEQTVPSNASGSDPDRNAVLSTGIAPDTGQHRIASSCQRHGTDRKLVALYCGGTLCQEAERIVTDAGNASHTFVDLGEDRYTKGRAHPMIDPRIRSAMMESAGDDADVLLFDVVLGDLAHRDPAGVVAATLHEAKARAQARGHDIQFFAALIGTDLDPQGFDGQMRTLVCAGVRVSISNETAALWAARALAEVGP
ncbi:MAG TPA: hypothetical protein VG815_17375 [Chloroflexota bacterium]|nr:hypothetical protein [Chloroflexota bacterium]